MPAAGAVWPLMGAEVSCISSIQAAERRAGRGSVGRAKGAASNRCVSHVGRQTRVAQATAPCRRRDDFGVRTDCRCIGWVQWEGEGVNCDLW
eukprot:scaffold12051_cov121-Isochrysis_galbana.AAC.1